MRINLQSCLMTLAIGAAVVLAVPASAQEDYQGRTQRGWGWQDRDHNRDHDRDWRRHRDDDRRRDSDHNRDWRRHRNRDHDWNRGTYGRGTGYYGGNRAAQFGYQDGLNDGRNDRSTGRRIDPRGNRNYRTAGTNYDRRDGDLRTYADQYRQAYLNGYQQGYNGRGGRYYGNGWYPWSR